MAAKAGAAMRRRRAVGAMTLPRGAWMPGERVVDAYVAALEDGAGRRLAHGEWGVTLPAGAAGDWPLDIGMRVDAGLPRIQAFAIPGANAPEDAEVLHWNRHTRIVRFARTR